MAFVAVAPSFVLSLQGIVEPSDIELDVSVAELVASILAALGPAVVAVYLLWRDDRLRAAGFEPRPAGFVLGYGAIGWVATFIALYSVLFVLAGVIVATGGDPVDSAEGSGFDLTLRTALAGLAVSLTAGLSEEVVFRAYAISRLEEAGYPRAAIWLPWALFTAVHLYQGPLALLYIGAVSLVFVWLYRWKRSVWPVVVAHAMYDVTIILLAAAVGG